MSKQRKRKCSIFLCQTTIEHLCVLMLQVIGKCYVLPLVDYVKMAPESVDEKDVFVCESRYNSRNRFFKKIKVSLHNCFFNPLVLHVFTFNVPKLAK